MAAGWYCSARLFGRLGLDGWIERRTGKETGFFRPSPMVEAWWSCCSKAAA